MITINCYQTVENRGQEETYNASPLHSSPGHQWLGQGYYFWTDSDYFAHFWGKTQYKKNYAILNYEVRVDEDDYLDLVGNVNDQLFFNELKQMYLDKLGFRKNVTVIEIIDFFRQEKIISYKAIKASDVPHKNERTAFSENKPETFVAPTRQQLLVVSGCEELVLNKKWYFPE